VSALAGKRALVTGAGHRLGCAIAFALGEHGMRIAVHYNRSREGAEETARGIVERGGEAELLSADLSDRQAARKLVDDAIAALGGLDLLVLSAAGFERVPYLEIDDDAWDRMLELDLTAQHVMAQRAAPALASSQGSMVFLTCSSATTPFRHHLPYVVAKGALRQLMRALALELAPDVRVNAVAPGTVMPPSDMSNDALERLRSRIPLGKIGGAEDVASAVVYLASAPFVTGQEILVDGGRSVAAIERFE
jgi:pteridine reductase